MSVEKNEKKYLGQKIRKSIELVLLFCITVWVGILCFYHLGEAATHNTDEARHIANAYEMFKNSKLWIHTYKYATDYFNYKPPLSMWCIMLCFWIFGINSFTMRMYSAMAWMLLYLVFVGFLWKKSSRLSSVLFGLAFISGLDLFFFHAARSADADALYLLLYTCAMLGLYLAEEKPYYLIMFGFCASLCFLAKCFHIASIFVIFLCYFPRLYKKVKLKHLIFCCLAGVIPVGIWAVIRFSFDGFTFFQGMLGREVVDRVAESSDYFGYLFYLLGQPACVASVVIAVGSAVLLAISGRAKTNVSKAGGESKAIARGICRWIYQNVVCKQSYLFLLWFLVPFLIYSASGAFMEWYCYVCFLPLYALFAIWFSKLLHQKGYLVFKIVFAGCLLVCVYTQASEAVTTLKYMENTGFRRDLQVLVENEPAYRGAEIYIEKSGQEYKPQNEWEQNSVADAYITGDFQPLDGGVPLFLEDDDALLIISKDLFEGYSEVLAGRVILVDGSDYLIFCNEFYG